MTFPQGHTRISNGARRLGCLAGEDCGTHIQARKAEISITMEAQPTFAPRAGDDERLDEVTLHAVEVGGLVMLVDEAERQQEQPGARSGALCQLAIDIELLNFKLARVRGGRHAVLD